MYADLVSLTSLETILNFMTILTVLVLVFFVVMIRRMAGMKKAIEELQKKNAELETATVAAKEAPQAVAESTVSEPVTEAVEPATVPADEPSLPVAGGPAPEVVAAIVAAIESCGFPSSSIRSIRPHRNTRHTGWVMAGRLANMR